MSRNILVTSDLSANSKAGVRFGIQLAKQTGLSIIFYNAIEVDKPTRWTDSRFDEHVKGEISDATEKLTRLVEAAYKDARVRPGKYSVVVERVRSVQEGIIKFAVARKAAFICMSTRGAGKIARLLGTNASYLIKNSPIPVLAIPRNYRASRIEHILYASDLNSLTPELKKVKKFADSVQSKVTVLHYDYLYQIEEVKKKFDKIAGREKKPGVNFYLEQFNIERSLGTHLKGAVRKFNPSVVVLFTKRNRDWFERLFLPSSSAEVSFDSKKPLLIYGK